jgi:hypothetical protein
MDRTSQKDITMSAQSEAALLVEEQLREHSPLDLDRLIGGMVDLPNGLVSSISSGPSADGSAPASGSGTNGSADGAQLIGSMVDLPGGLVSSVTPTGSDNQVSANIVGAKNPHLGAQLIGGTVDLPGGLIASGTSDLPENLGHRVGPTQHFPTGIQAHGIAENAGQLHQLVTAMAGFGDDQGSVITNLTVQNEVEAARTSLAASLHFAQP